VVIAIIALLVSILLPALGAARNTARTVVCSSKIKQITTAQLLYSNDYKEWLAGAPNTSGYDLMPASSETTAPFTQWRGSGYVKNSAPSFNGIAVQNFDWAGPLVAAMGIDGPSEKSVSANSPQRQARFDWLQNDVEVLRCPSNNVTTALRWPDLNKPGYMISYSTSTQFMSSEFLPPFGTATLSGGARPERRNMYQPRISRLGSQPSAKIAFYEGSRFLELNGGGWRVTVDDHAAANFGGAFSDVGGWFAGSNGFVRVNPGNAIHPIRFAFRHGGKGPPVGNVAFFDGHVETLRDLDATNPDFWFPGGTRFTAQLDTWADTRVRWQQKTSAGYVVP